MPSKDINDLRNTLRPMFANRPVSPSDKLSEDTPHIDLSEILSILEKIVASIDNSHTYIDSIYNEVKDLHVTIGNTTNSVDASLKAVLDKLSEDQEVLKNDVRLIRDQLGFSNSEQD